jgi:hypothetical protein
MYTLSRYDYPQDTRTTTRLPLNKNVHSMSSTFPLERTYDTLSGAQYCMVMLYNAQICTMRVGLVVTTRS